METGDFHEAEEATRPTEFTIQKIIFPVWTQGNRKIDSDQTTIIQLGYPCWGKIHVYQQLHGNAETRGTSISSTRHAA